MKKVLLLTISIFLISIAQMALAYETVIVPFPPNDMWHPVLHQKRGNEAILLYVPNGQTRNNWTRGLFFHSYKSSARSVAQVLSTSVNEMTLLNSSQQYEYLKYTPENVMVTRCITKNKYTPSQCEIFRVAKSFDGVITMHYINKNNKDFHQNFEQWMHIIDDIRIYQSYFRDNRVLDKELQFEI